jgi:hypothetical protein
VHGMERQYAYSLHLSSFCAHPGRRLSASQVSILPLPVD